MGVTGYSIRLGHTPMTFSSKRAPMLVAALLSLTLSAGMAAAPVLAQDKPAAAPQEISPDALALARKYLDLTDHSGVYETTIVQAGINTYQQLLPTNPGIEPQLNKAIENTITSYRDKKGDLFDQMARLYAITFSTEELQAIVDFYSSPAGQKLAKANAQLNPALQDIMKVFSTNLNKEFFAKVRADLKAQGIDN